MRRPVAVARREYIAHLRLDRRYWAVPGWRRVVCLVLLPIVMLEWVVPPPKVFANPCNCASSVSDDSVRVTKRLLQIRQ